MTRVDRSFIIATPRNSNARLTPPAASSAASSLVLAQREMRRRRSRGVVSIVSLLGLDFQGMGVFRSDEGV